MIEKVRAVAMQLKKQFQILLRKKQNVQQKKQSSEEGKGKHIDIRV